MEKYLIYENGAIREQAFLDLSDKLDNLSNFYSEKGLLGMAVHPKFSQNGKFYVYYSAPSDKSDHKSVVEEYRVNPKNNNLSRTEGIQIIEFDQPEGNHNGGDLAFGPDGYLYITSGDGGGANDRHGSIGNGQDLNTLLGKILRIDIDNGYPYTVPEDNPFVGKDGRDEIWAYGLRNPWRISFDPKSGRLFTGDVGQNEYEEIDIIEKGRNYGWRVMEGFNCFNPSKDCDKVGLTLPIHEYPHSVGISVTGGYVYRGKAIPELYGKYVYGDWNGVLFTLEEDSEGLWTSHSLNLKSFNGNDINTYINSFGEDEEGELYVLTQKKTGPRQSNSKIYKIVPAN